MLVFLRIASNLERGYFRLGNNDKLLNSIYCISIGYIFNIKVILNALHFFSIVITYMYKLYFESVLNNIVYKYSNNA